MPHNSSQWVTHTINGGWATDYGNTFYATPQNAQIDIPWCKTCENVKFYQDGGFGKYPGFYRRFAGSIKAPSSSTLIESSVVTNLFKYVRLGASLTGTERIVAVVGSWLYDVTSTPPILIGDVRSTYPNLHHLTTFNDLLIIGAANGPRSWDQTTFQSLAGTPPNFTFSTHHAGRHWAAGIAATPSRLYYSAVGNPEDWVGAGSGSIDIDPGDGDAIVGILSWKRELWVFKGPHRLSIHRITGASPSDFARVPFIYGISTAGIHSIFPVGDDFAFWSPRGSCHSLTTTSSYGDYTQGYINFPILSWCRDNNNILNGDLGRTWKMVTDTSQSITYAIFNNDITLLPPYTGFTPRPLVLMMDWKFRTETNTYPRFTKLNIGRSFTSVAMISSSFDSSQLVPAFGDHAGFIDEELLQYNATFLSGGTALPYTIETPALTYGPSVHKKTITSVSVEVTENFNSLNGQRGSLQFSYGGRQAPGGTLTFSSSGGAVLGTFVLGIDQLGSQASIHGFSEDVAGESSAFTYTLKESSPAVLGAGTDVKVKHFGVLITPSGESLETI